MIKLCYSCFNSCFDEISLDLSFNIKFFNVPVEKIVFFGTLKYIKTDLLNVFIYDSKSLALEALRKFIKNFILNDFNLNLPLIEEKKFYFYENSNNKGYFSLNSYYAFLLKLYLCDGDIRPCCKYFLNPQCKYPNQIHYFPFKSRDWWWPWYIYKGEECCDFSSQLKNIKELLG